MIHTDHANRVHAALVSLIEQMGQDAGHTVATLGVEAGIPSSRLFRIFSGEESLTVDHLYRIAQTLNFGVGDLFALAERQVSHESRHA